MRKKIKNVSAIRYIVAMKFLATLAFGQESDTLQLDEVVITGTKYAVPVEKSGKSIYKIAGRELEKYSGRTVADLLNDVPGIQMDGNYSTPASALSYFIRGGTNRHSLILIDGMPLNDPTAISTDYDLRQLALDQVKSLEILRGGLSTLYGTGAAAAVINIELKDSGNRSFQGDINLNGGSFASFGQDVNVRGTVGKLSYAVNGNNYVSEGLSAAEDNDPSSEFNKDGINRQNGLLKLGYDFNDRWDLDITTAYDRFDADFDGGQFLDGDNAQENDQIRVGLKPTYIYKSGKGSLNVLYNRNTKEFKGGFPSVSTGRNLQLDYNHQHHLHQNIKSLFGIYAQHLEYDETQNGFESLSSDTARFNIVAPFVSVVYNHPGGLNLHGGLRLNVHSEYGTELVYNLNPSYLIQFSENVKIKALASISKSFVSPSLFQVFSFFGTRDLHAEDAINYEGGLAFYVNNTEFNFVYYRRDEDNPIGFVSQFDDQGNFVGGRYENISSERTVEGIEVDLSIPVSSKVEFAGQYALTTSDIQASLSRIPKHKMAVSVDYSPFNESLISLRLSHTGKRDAVDFNTGNTVELENFRLVDLYLSHKVFDKKLALYGTINNVFDEDFIGILGFTTRGRNYQVGARLSF